MTAINEKLISIKEFNELVTSVDEFIADKEIEKAGLKPEEVVKEGFKIETNEQANYFVKSVKEARTKITSIDAIREQKKEEYCKMIDEWANNIIKPLSNTEQYLTSVLNSYAAKQRLKNPKSKTIKLPYGDLKFKKVQDKYEYDDEKVKSFLHDNKLEQYIKIKEEIKKADIKKAITVKGEEAFIDNKIIPGISIIEQPERFEVK